MKIVAATVKCQHTKKTSRKMRRKFMINFIQIVDHLYLSVCSLCWIYGIQIYSWALKTHYKKVL